MAIPGNIDPQAIQLFREADWLWNPLKKAFVEARQPERESTSEYRNRSPRSIGYDELRDHGLAANISGALLEDGLTWLRRELSLER